MRSPTTAQVFHLALMVAQARERPQLDVPKLVVLVLSLCMHGTNNIVCLPTRIFSCANTTVPRQIARHDPGRSKLSRKCWTCCCAARAGGAVSCRCLVPKHSQRRACLPRKPNARGPIRRSPARHRGMAEN
ncbi:hypothetical protein FA95DRAFT_956703 [Auriscalpium vulgare]|uniref:Uncharacterized protein n=1 Tax=Auriscalpium vulgare TaxID=40419 RepID=A0ACB8R8H5_9AGAM|nr:hypothetical protein FA95DRAFT_956703 [Auriscalpium vulgare]